MGRQLTTAAAAERQERNHEGLQHLTPGGGGQPWHEPEGAGGERGDGHGGVWVGGDQGGQGPIHHTHPHREHLVGCLNGDNGSDHSVQLRLCFCLFDRMDIDGVIHENEDPISSGSLSFREVRMENMVKGCGRSDNIEGVERRPRIVIPTVESKVDSLTTTTYTSTVYSATYTFAVATSYCTTAGYTGALASLSVCA